MVKTIKIIVRNSINCDTLNDGLENDILISILRIKTMSNFT